MNGEAFGPSRSFGGDAERYDRARPPYPDAAIDRLGLEPGMRVLDVGCGTGALARQLVARGCDVLGVEPDERMAAVATERIAGLAVELGTFESWDPQGRSFDAVVSGMAWHWVDAVAGAAKAGAVLVDGGRFAALWNAAGLPAEVRAAVLPAYERHAPTLASTALILAESAEVDGPDEDARALRESGRFTDVRRDAVDWPHRYTTASWVDELATRSSHRMLDPDVRSALLDEVATAIDAIGGAFDVTYRTTLLLARAIEGP